ncbi:MAG: hypothetical protein JRG91_14870 [Deltaproteobacteria bacterium]|nr:hypothetical protein [Deltaproteobacteria bacterium]
MPRTTIIALLSILLATAGCGSKSKTTGDADGAEDAPAETTTDGTGEPAVDPSPDGVEDPVEEPVEEPVEDPSEEPDAAPDAEEDAEDDPEDAVDASDASDGGGADGSGASPSLARYAKGAEITTGSCNPDGSTTEALAATYEGGGCISVTHYCAWMLDCTTLVATLAYTPPLTLTITETETGMTCTHLGWFNPQYGICGLTSGTWTVRIDTLSTTVTVP